MIAYRLGSARYPANDGSGAALYGGRWNPVGYPAIYAAESRALCALEVLAHNKELAGEYAITGIIIPDHIRLESPTDPGDIDTQAAAAPPYLFFGGSHYSSEPPTTMVSIYSDRPSTDPRLEALAATAEAAIILSQLQGWHWIKSEAAAVLRVPSIIIPDEYNYILNPRHPDFAQIEFGPSVRFRFDERLRQRL
jgi:RES domain-containing protein